MWYWLMVIVIGAICGWIASALMGSKSKGLLMNIVLGIVGGVVGKIVLGLIGFSATKLLGNIISGVIGTCILIAVARFLTKK